MVRLFLIDGTALAYRSFFAFAGGPRGGLTTKAGVPTGAVFGYIQTLRSLLEREQPDLVAVAFDGPRADLERTRIYADYKSTRSKMPDELVPQLEQIERATRAYGIPVLGSEGHEADDVIGTLAVQGRTAGMEVYIVTGDKDFMQLVDDKLKLWNLRASTRAPEIIGPKEVEAKFGVRPAQMIDLLALMGDSSDNVPGVPRIGAKTAAELLQQFGSLDALIARSGEIPKPGQRQTLESHVDQARLSRQLVTIHTDVPLACSVGDLAPPRPRRAELEALFRELEFDSLLASLPPDQAAAEELRQDYRRVEDAAQLETLLAELRASGGFALDTETTSLDARHADLVGISVCCAAGAAYYVPCNAQPPVLDGGRAAIVAAFKPLLEDPDLRKYGQNLKYDMTVLRRAGVEIRGIAGDTMLASYCLQPGQGQHNLDTLALRWFSYKKIATKDLIGTGKQQKTFDQIDVDQVTKYAAEDADFVWRLQELLHPKLEEAGLMPLYRDLELPLIGVLAEMEWNGITVDRDHLARLSAEWSVRIRDIEARIYDRAGEEFNINAPAQVGQILFDKLEVHRAANISRPRRTPKGQYKTDHTILEKLARFHEVPELILQHRMLTKLKGTYVDSLPTMIDPDTGCIHTSFNQAVAATGRLSSDAPNLQNIPIRSREGREVRRAFVSRGEGWLLLSADYSQIELRILAHMSGEPVLVDAFNEGEDIHARTAALVHGLLPKMVTPELRNQAKVVNYGLMYGMGPSRLAQETGMKPPEAKKFIEAYFRALPKVKSYLDGCLEQARQALEVWTLFGRRRPLPEIQSTNTMQRVAAENMAVNTPMQGTAADIVKRAMLALHAELHERGLRTKLLLQVHDELVLDVPEDELEEVRGVVRRCMVEAADLRVPLEVSLGVGANWLEAH